MGKAVRVIEIVWTAGALLTKMLLSLAAMVWWAWCRE